MKNPKISLPCPQIDPEVRRWLLHQGKLKFYFEEFLLFSFQPESFVNSELLGAPPRFLLLFFSLRSRLHVLFEEHYYFPVSSEICCQSSEYQCYEDRDNCDIHVLESTPTLQNQSPVEFTSTIMVLFFVMMAIYTVGLNIGEYITYT